MPPNLGLSRFLVFGPTADFWSHPGGGSQTDETVKPLLNEAYKIAVSTRPAWSHRLGAGQERGPHRDGQAARDARDADDPRQQLAAADVLLDEEDRGDHGHPRDIHQAKDRKDRHPRPAAAEAVEAMRRACPDGGRQPAAEVVGHDETKR